MRSLIYLIILFFVVLTVVCVEKPVPIEKSVSAPKQEVNYDSLRVKLGLDSTAVFIENKYRDPNVKAIFYIPVGKEDTFYYAVQNNDSVFLFALVRGKGVRIIKE